MSQLAQKAVLNFMIMRCSITLDHLWGRAPLEEDQKTLAQSSLHSFFPIWRSTSRYTYKGEQRALLSIRWRSLPSLPPALFGHGRGFWSSSGSYFWQTQAGDRRGLALSTTVTSATARDKQFLSKTVLQLSAKRTMDRAQDGQKLSRGGEAHLDQGRLNEIPPPPHNRFQYDVEGRKAF